MAPGRQPQTTDAAFEFDVLKTINANQSKVSASSAVQYSIVKPSCYVSATE